MPSVDEYIERKDGENMRRRKSMHERKILRHSYSGTSAIEYEIVGQRPHSIPADSPGNVERGEKVEGVRRPEPLRLIAAPKSVFSPISQTKKVGVDV